jgi:hypothetical protein
MRRTITVVALFAIAAMTVPTSAAASNGLVYPPGSSPLSVSYRTWAERWAAYAFSAPIGVNPLVHPDDCALSIQIDDGVAFVPASGGGDVTVKCSIPEDTPILVTPGGEIGTIPFDGDTLSEVRHKVNQIANSVTGLKLRIDGTVVRPIDSFRTHSKGLFTLHVPKHNILSGSPPRGDTQAYIAGWFIMLRGFDAGTHRVFAHDVFLSGSKNVEASTTYIFDVQEG